jgi:hypothetical protein
MNDDEHVHGEDCDHEHDELDYEPSSPEVLAERRARLTETLNALTLDDLNTHLHSAPDHVRAALTNRLSVRLDPKFIKGGMGRLIRTKIRGLSPGKQVEMAAELTAGLDQESSEFLGEESFEMPTRDELDRLVGHLLASHPVVIVRAYLACTAAADAPVAAELDKILAEDDRVALAGV